MQLFVRENPDITSSHKLLAKAHCHIKTPCITIRRFHCDVKQKYSRSWCAETMAMDWAHYNIKHFGGNPRARGMSGDPRTPGDAASRRRYGFLGRSSDELPRTERSGGRRLSAHASSEAKGLSERASELVGRTKGTDKTLLSHPSLLFPLPRFSLAKFRAGISVRSHRSET